MTETSENTVIDIDERNYLRKNNYNTKFQQEPENYLEQEYFPQPIHHYIQTIVKENQI